MTVGIPGTGVGGLFYLAAAMWLPFRSLGRRMVERPGTTRAAFRQALLAIAMFGGMWATGWLVALLIGPEIVVRGAFGQRLAEAGKNNLIQWTLVSLGYLVLGALLLAVEVARVVVRRRTPTRRPSGGHQSPVAALQ